ncbi:MAG: fibrobacter succinogenes major paralogous domain-containing protein [Bacteroidota bacterium]|jgi:uncharacterized protein (TIGR02145 family)
MKTQGQKIIRLAILLFITFLTTQCKKDKTIPVFVTDIDGNVYHTITIGNMVWLKENLRTGRYRNGDVIPNVTDTAQWTTNNAGVWCYYRNLPSNNSTYGKLYNWYAVSDLRNIAPAGWHVASEFEWINLTKALGSDSIAGGKLKETGTLHWAFPNLGATNAINFTALPGGCLAGGYPFTFNGIGQYGNWWTSMSVWFSDYNDAYARGISFNACCCNEGKAIKTWGLSVRCVMDY